MTLHCGFQSIPADCPLSTGSLNQANRFTFVYQKLSLHDCLPQCPGRTATVGRIEVIQTHSALKKDPEFKHPSLALMLYQAQMWGSKQAWDTIVVS